MTIYLNLSTIACLFISLKSRRIKRLFLYMLIVANTSLVVLSFSRSGILINVAIVLSFIWIYYRKVRSLLLTAIVASGVFIVRLYNSLIYSTDLSVLENLLWRQKSFSATAKTYEGRFVVYSNVLELFREGHLWIWGYPIDRWLERFERYPHNSLIDILLSSGLVLFLSFIALLLISFISMFRRMETLMDRFWFTVVSTFLSYIFAFSLFQIKLFWLVLVILIVSFANGRSTPRTIQ